MRRMGFGLGVALITFCLGVGASWGALIFLQPPISQIESPALCSIMSPTLEPPSAAPQEPATIVFSRSHKNRYGRILAEFIVTNISREPLGYAGASSNPNWDRYYYVRRGSELTEPDRVCGTGMASYTLSAGTSVKFEVVVGDEPGRVQVGFEFYAGKNGMQRTIWSDDVYVSE